MASPEDALTLTQTAPGIPASRRRGLRASGHRIRPVLAGLGAFLMVFGLLLRLYVAPRLIAAPVGVYMVVTLADPHASYFDQRARPPTRSGSTRGPASRSTWRSASFPSCTHPAGRAA